MYEDIFDYNILRYIQTRIFGLLFAFMILNDENQPTFSHKRKSNALLGPKVRKLRFPPQAIIYTTTPHQSTVISSKTPLPKQEPAKPKAVTAPTPQRTSYT